MNSENRTDGSTFHISLSGRLTFADYAAFRQLIAEAFERDVQRYVFDMSGLEFIDSAGLGMLLLAREDASQHSRPIALQGATGQVKRILDVARFDSIFSD